MDICFRRGPNGGRVLGDEDPNVRGCSPDGSREESVVDDGSHSEAHGDGRSVRESVVNRSGTESIPGSKPSLRNVDVGCSNCCQIRIARW